MTACALIAMHRNVAHDWTVADLSRLCGLSRSSFAARFSKVVGTGPIKYLMRWRMALAKDELNRGERSSGQIALAIGFKSSSAFSTAFTRAVGCAPKHSLLLKISNGKRVSRQSAFHAFAPTASGATNFRLCDITRRTDAARRDFNGYH